MDGPFFKIRFGRVGRGCSEPSGQIQVLGIQEGSGAFKTSTLSEIGVHPDLYNMAVPVVEFSREGYKIRKVFG